MNKYLFLLLFVPFVYANEPLSEEDIKKLVDAVHKVDLAICKTNYRANYDPAGPGEAHVDYEICLEDAKKKYSSGELEKKIRADISLAR